MKFSLSCINDGAFSSKWCFTLLEEGVLEYLQGQLFGVQSKSCLGLKNSWRLNEAFNDKMYPK